MRSIIIGASLGALTLALTSTSALAGVPGLRGSIDANYAHVDGDSDVGADEYGVNGHLVLPLGDSDFNVQVDGGYANIHGDGQDVDGWDISGAAFWRSDMGTLGVAVAHGSLDANTGIDGDITAYGAFGELFLGDFTLAGRGGWYDGGQDLDGAYWGATAKFYVMPDLAISGNVGQVHINHIGHTTDWGVGAEWQVTDRTPLSLFGNYTHSDLSGSSFSFDTWMVGVRWRFGEEDGSQLIDGDRTNVVRDTTVNLNNALEF